MVRFAEASCQTCTGGCFQLQNFLGAIAAELGVRLQRPWHLGLMAQKKEQEQRDMIDMHGLNQRKMKFNDMLRTVRSKRHL